MTEAQVQALEKAKQKHEAIGEFESEHPGYCGGQDTFYVGTIKGVGRIYQQTFIDTYSKVAAAKLYDTKTPVTAADLLNDRVVPFFEEHGIALLRVLSDRGTEYCGTEVHPTSCTSRSRTSSTRERRHGARRRTASASVFTRRSSTSSIASPCARRSTQASRSFKPTSTLGCRSTTSSDRIKVVGATAKHQCRRSSTHCQSRRKSW